MTTEEKLAEISTNYQEAFNFLDPRKQRQVNQIVLLNNLRRGDQNIASTLLFTLFSRILSNQYDDKIQIKFVPGEEVDQNKINSLNILAQNDYREMNKAKLDYDWLWDAFFFGTGYVETLRFDKKRKLMLPSVINPLVMGYDPYFTDCQDWRYYYKWITKSKWELKKLIKNGTIDGIADPSEIASGVDPYLWQYKIKVEQAKLANVPATDSAQGDVYQILEYFGYDDDGDKCVYWTDKNFSKQLMSDKLDLKDAEDGGSLWPIVKKEPFREPHSSVVFSVADLLEDKHRAKSVLLNLAYIAAKDKANPIYQYNPDKVNDVSAFFSRQVNQHISVSDTQGGAVMPLNTQEPMSAGLIQFISMLTQEANDPIGTGMSLQPVKKGKQSATESAIQQQLNDLAQSLQSKILQFGEQEFWSHWYHRYKRYAKKGDEKIATVVGVKGMTFEKINLGDMYTKNPPGVLVYSAKEAEYKELVLRRDLMQMYPQLQETLGADGMRNFNKYVFFPKFLSDPSLMDTIIPDSIDEIKAKEENDSIDKNTLPNVAPTDDHLQHIYIHRMSKNTWAKWIHLQWHEELLSMEKKQEQEAKQQEGQQVDEGGGEEPKAEKPKPGAKKQDPKNAAVPLQQEAQPVNPKP